MLSINTILWPTDSSLPSLKALDAAIALAKQFEAKIYALQVVDPIPTFTETGFASTPLQTFDLPLYEHELMESTRKALSETVSQKIPDVINTEIYVEIGNPKNFILDFCKKKNVDLIVMATHGRTGLARFMLGSVAESTIRQSSVPTLIIPDTDE